MPSFGLTLGVRLQLESALALLATLSNGMQDHRRVAHGLAVVVFNHDKLDRRRLANVFLTSGNSRIRITSKTKIVNSGRDIFIAIF